MNVASVELRKITNDDPFVLFGELAAGTCQRKINSRNIEYQRGIADAESDRTAERVAVAHAVVRETRPTLLDPNRADPGNGLLLFFRVDDFEAALQRARALSGRFEEDPHVNPNTRTKEFSLRDPDGYYVSISAL